MPFAILRFQKKKEGGIAHCERHNERKKAAYKSNPDIDIELSAQNYHLAGPPRYTYKREVNQKIKEAGCRVRKDSIRMVEALITASPELMNAFDEQEQREYFEHALEFMQNKVGADNILSAIVHVDERTPHMHLVFCPITEDNRLSAKEILGNQKKLSEWQTEYHEWMSERWPELERGRSAIETHRKHIPTWLFKKGEEIDKKCEILSAAIDDIKGISAGKKREEAITLLNELVPEMNRFRSEVGKVTGYINELEVRLDVRGSANSSLYRQLEEAELKAQGAEYEIWKLKHKVEQQQKLLAKVPEDILNQLNCKERGQER